MKHIDKITITILITSKTLTRQVISIVIVNVLHDLSQNLFDMNLDWHTTFVIQ